MKNMVQIELPKIAGSGAEFKILRSATTPGRYALVYEDRQQGQKVVIDNVSFRQFARLRDTVLHFFPYDGDTAYQPPLFHQDAAPASGVFSSVA